jgi:hypothetical protein
MTIHFLDVPLAECVTLKPELFLMVRRTNDLNGSKSVLESGPIYPII